MPLPRTSAVVAPGPHDVRGRRNSLRFTQPPSNLHTAAISFNIRRQIRLEPASDAPCSPFRPLYHHPPRRRCARGTYPSRAARRGAVGARSAPVADPVPPAALRYATAFSRKPASSSVRLKNEGPHSIFSQGDDQGDLPWPMTERPSASMSPERLT